VKCAVTLFDGELGISRDGGGVIKTYASFDSDPDAMLFGQLWFHPRITASNEKPVLEYRKLMERKSCTEMEYLNEVMSWRYKPRLLHQASGF
jgi:hypothetical protein